MEEIKYPFVAVDFDGTLCEDEFPEIGKPKQRCIRYVKELAAQGSRIILYTCRENGTRKLLDEAVEFCRKEEIPLYAVNENPENQHPMKYGLRPENGRKVYADLYIDDKAVDVEALGSFDLEKKKSGADKELPKGGKEADCHWTEVMKLAEKYGFITMAAGGTAVLLTNSVQLKEYGMKEYTRIQRMNGRCPKKIGMSGCIHSLTEEFYCSVHCELYNKP